MCRSNLPKSSEIKSKLGQKPKLGEKRSEKRVATSSFIHQEISPADWDASAIVPIDERGRFSIQELPSHIICVTLYECNIAQLLKQTYRVKIPLFLSPKAQHLEGIKTGPSEENFIANKQTNFNFFGG